MNKIKSWWWPEDTKSPGTIGSAHGVDYEAPKDSNVDKLRQVVAEVTRGRIPVPIKHPPGFIRS
jgi:hypothetical protein